MKSGVGRVGARGRAGRESVGAGDASRERQRGRGEALGWRRKGWRRGEREREEGRREMGGEGRERREREIKRRR